jgi:hypothetical protein
VSSRRSVAELLEALAAVMAEQDLSWYLFGAQAATVWGSPRLSADVDVTATIAPAATDAFIRSMGNHAFDLLIDDPEFVARTRVLPFVHRRTRMLLDIVLAGPGLEEEFLRRAISVDIRGTSIPVISPEDLIITKVLAGRPKDIEDILGVIQERRTSLDETRLLSVLRVLEQALGQSDLLPVFEKAWSEGESVKPRPPSRSTRRRKKD